MLLLRNATLVVADRHEVPNADQWDESSGFDFFFEPDATLRVTVGSRV